MLRSILKGKQMPREFWAEAVAYAVYFLNRDIYEALENQDGNLILCCFFMDCDLICFEEAIQEKK